MLGYSGLIRAPRNPDNGYRPYGAAESGRLRVIRMLNQAGYSQMAISGRRRGS
jgi:DNA-binding transcriptional MerR regulator